MARVKVGIIAFYAPLAFLGGFWLCCFNSARVRGQFGLGGAPPEPGGRPLSIGIIAWFLMIGGVMGLGFALLPFPGVVFGQTLTGWPARVYYLLCGAFSVWIGTGQLRLKPASRVFAPVLCIYGMVHSLLFALLPGLQERFRASMDILPQTLRGAGNPATVYPAPTAMLCLSAALCLIPIWFLAARRDAFRKAPTAPTDSASW
jgi:hypothetical protein